MDFLNKVFKLVLVILVLAFFAITCYRLYTLNDPIQEIDEIIDERKKEIEEYKKENIDLYIRIDDFLRLHEPKKNI